MRKNIYFLLVISILFLQTSLVTAQLPLANYFYYHSGTIIYNYNTTTGTESVNTIALPSGAGGLAVNNNFFGANPAMTFYTTVGGFYYYWNGSSWVNTGHSTGNTSAVNIGGAGPYIFNLNGIGQQMYRYNGAANGTFLMNMTGWGGPFDCSGDASGNFYVMKTSALPHTLTQYSPTGAVMAVYSMVGFPSSGAGGGFAFINGLIYTTIGSTRCWGSISGTTITYGGPLTLMGSGTSDYANWPLPIVPLPVELSSFTGSYNQDTRMNDINWVTLIETNNDYFTLEFSEDGIQWEWLEIIDGAGSTNELMSYATSHDSPYDLTYYRLKQTDLNGETKTYDPIAITKISSADHPLHIYPNPVADNVIYIESNGKDWESYTITDQTGRIVHQVVNPPHKHSVDVTALEPGVYFISSYFMEEKITTKFIKN